MVVSTPLAIVSGVSLRPRTFRYCSQKAKKGACTLVNSGTSLRKTSYRFARCGYSFHKLLVVEEAGMISFVVPSKHSKTMHTSCSVVRSPRFKSATLSIDRLPSILSASSRCSFSLDGKSESFPPGGSTKPDPTKTVTIPKFSRQGMPSVVAMRSATWDSTQRCRGLDQSIHSSTIFRWTGSLGYQWSIEGSRLYLSKMWRARSRLSAMNSPPSKTHAGIWCLGLTRRNHHWSCSPFERSIS
mmetsp:Transcript_3829/g.8603  ORF Transcript_3829/g.8603 Transcript_3829/m.8603 type:complete len:242 (-) Transcript_3829:144-869(-)